jgi:RNA polymerase sigma-70 factor (ECF subfamily)
MSESIQYQHGALPPCTSADGRRRFARRQPLGDRDEDVRLAGAIAAAKHGSRDALSYLYCRYADSVYACVRAVLGNDQDAEDVTQTVFAKLLTSIRQYQPRAVPFAAWLLRVARNAALDEIRRRRVVPVAEVRGSDPSPAASGGDAGRAAALLDALDELTADQRRVVVLRHLAGLTPGEIAGVIDSTEASVHGLHHRGRQTLQRALAMRGAAPAVRRAAS